MSTDKDQAVLALDHVSETCTAALSALSARSLHDPSASLALAVLQKDLASILSLIYASTTKIALALKPSSPTYSASITPLRDISKHVSAFAHCIALFDPDVHGVTIAKEVEFLARDIIEAVHALAQTFRAHAADRQAGDKYMVRTGAIHELIDATRGTEGISVDNRAAVCKRWQSDHGALEDGLREVGEMIEEAEDEEGKDDNGIGDGWDEIGIGSGDKMSSNELERTKTVHTLLRLSTLLHKRVVLDLLTPNSTPISNAALDTLLSHSASLLVTSDDLVSTLYVPQDPANVCRELVTFRDVIHIFQTGLQGFLQGPQLEEQFQNLDIHNRGQKSKKKDKRKWFETCFAQIYKVADNFALILDQQNIET